jgi:hypothetical protein
MPVTQVQNAPRLDLILEGEPGTIALTSFIRALDNARALIEGVDAALSHNSRGVVEWYVEDLRIGSLQATLVAKARRGAGLVYTTSKADEIASAVVVGIETG